MDKDGDKYWGSKRRYKNYLIFSCPVAYFSKRILIFFKKFSHFLKHSTKGDFGEKKDKMKLRS